MARLLDILFLPDYEPMQAALGAFLQAEAEAEARPDGGKDAPRVRAKRPTRPGAEIVLPSKVGAVEQLHAVEMG